MLAIMKVVAGSIHLCIFDEQRQSGIAYRTQGALLVSPAWIGTIVDIMLICVFVKQTVRCSDLKEVPSVVPDDRSLHLWYIIETLFIIHTEKERNMICPVEQDAGRTYGWAYNLFWCRGLDHPPMSSVAQPDMTSFL